MGLTIENRFGSSIEFVDPVAAGWVKLLGFAYEGVSVRRKPEAFLPCFPSLL